MNLRGHFLAEEKDEKGKGGREKDSKERGRRIHPLNKFLVTA